MISSITRYDQWFDTSPGREIFELEVQCLKEAFRGIQRPWLEIGVGTGKFAEKLKIDFGVDPSEEMLRKTFRRGIKSARAMSNSLPVLAGVVLLVGLIHTLIPKFFHFSKNVVLDSIIESGLGSMLGKKTDLFYSLVI